MVSIPDRRTARPFLTFAAVGAVVAGMVAGCSAAPPKSGPASGPAGRYGQVAPPTAAPGTGGERRAGSGISPEVSAAEQPLSTFAVDVDTASYGYARRLLQDGRRPDPTTIRPEEFINALRQDYRQPAGNGFAVLVDGARLPNTHAAGAGASDLRLMRVGLQTRAQDAANRADAALTFVVDVSGSMGEPGKLDLVRDALNTLVEQLRPTDSVAIVGYDDKARVLRPMTAVRDRATLHAAIGELRPGGSTNLEAGLVTGYRVAREGFRDGATNRVILLSDGLANVGNTEPEPILRQVRDAAAKRIALLGVGVGSDYGDALMEQLADQGDGYVVYVSELAQARRVFVEQLPATLAVRALDAKVQVTFNPAVVATYRLIGYDNRALNASDFRNDRVDGGEVGPGHAVTALYAVRLRSGGYPNGDAGVAQARIRWLDPASREPNEATAAVAVTGLDGAFGTAAPRLRQCYAAAYFAEVLRNSRYGTEVRLADLGRLADDVAAATDDPDVSELAGLVRKAAGLYG